MNLKINFKYELLINLIKHTFMGLFL